MKTAYLVRNSNYRPRGLYSSAIKAVQSLPVCIAPERQAAIERAIRLEGYWKDWASTENQLYAGYSILRMEIR